VKKAKKATKGKRTTNKRADRNVSAEANRWLTAATAEFNRKQDVLKQEWGFGSFERWAFDPATKVFSLTFTDGSGLDADGQVLGTYSPTDGSWEWAWNNPNIEPEAAVPADMLKQFGRRLGLSYLKLGMVPAPTREFASYLCAIGTKATDAIGAYLGGGDPVEVAIVLFNPRRKLKAA